MTVDIDNIAATLADDTTITDEELIRLIIDLRAVARQTPVVDLEKYKIRKVLEACATLRDLDWSGSASAVTHRRSR
ncbi:hypothetical protein [Aliihoeflea sp. 40Bstr573]|uniref:hypothetical protein n=1 Tax=Aliihoeflea sp. 40Bstr573 TaxID=2696467 RepID=UPI002094511D|nr:hypothetical protein [Aliihoeflea sp. 40Bstr573]MCO6387082.1 hypothetical protein [Aliihoeflea sp. 40Bstr573]